MLALLWRFAAEAARETRANTPRGLARAGAASRLDRPSYAPLLIEAVAAALEAFEAPPVEAEAGVLETVRAGDRIDIRRLRPRPSARRRCNCPPGMLAALAQAA